LKIVFTISPGFPGHRCISLLALLGISCFFKLAWLRIAGHRLELPALLGYRFFLQDYIVFHSCLTISPGSAGHRWHRCLSCQGHLSWHPWASLRIAGHRIAAYLSWHRRASLVSSQLRMAGHRRSSPGIAGRSWITFFLQDYIVFHSRFIISPGIAGHLGHRCVSLLASLGIFRSLGIAAHRWASQLSFSCKLEILQR